METVTYPGSEPTGSRADDRTQPEPMSRALEEERAGRRRAERELQAIRQSAENALRSKVEFIANVSHEIRTPMNAILGAADLLGETSLTPEQRRFLHILKRAADMLLEQVTNILDYSKGVGGRLALEEIPFDLTELIEEIGKFFALRAHEKGLELICHVTPDVPGRVVGDPTRLRQILVNLIGNAIKFTKGGEVVLRVEPDRRSDHAGALLFSVSDSGLGIPADKLDVIFEPFTQVDASTTREYGGTGLGLSIAKRLVQMMKGDIWVQSDLGRGSTFHFSVRFDLPDESRPPTRPALELNGLRILVVDDNGTSRIFLKELLSALGASVKEVEGGAQALVELKRHHQNGAAYQLVFLDCRMPGMGGFQVAEALKTESAILGTIIMMLPSNHRTTDIARAWDLGMAGCLIKPVTRSNLLDAVRTARDASRVAAPPSTSVAIPAHRDGSRSRRILLAEDCPDNRALVKFFLRNTPYDLDLAENGKIAVDLFQSNPYDLVLVDLRMPVMDGCEAIEAIRRWERKNDSKTTPIVVLSASSEKDQSLEALLAGCGTYLAKPIQREQLIRVIQGFVPISFGDPPVDQRMRG